MDISISAWMNEKEKTQLIFRKAEAVFCKGETQQVNMEN